MWMILKGKKCHEDQKTEILKIHKCETCDVAFYGAGELNRHIRIVHEGVKNHKCEICGKTFGRPGSLKTHIISVHNTTKHPSCTLCSKKFSRLDSLHEHIKSIHEGVKQHKCKICNYRSARKYNLKSHIRHIHNDLRNSEVLNFKQELNSFSKDKHVLEKTEDKSQGPSKHFHNFDHYDELLFMKPLVLLRKWQKIVIYK